MRGVNGMSEGVLGADIGFWHDLDMGTSGEGRLVSGSDCLAQDLIHALTTPKGGIPWHPDYGIDIYKFVKMANNPINRLQLEQEVLQTVAADPRVAFGSVRFQIIGWDMNKIEFKVICTPIVDEHPLNMVFGWGAYDAEGKVVAA